MWAFYFTGCENLRSEIQKNTKISYGTFYKKTLFWNQPKLISLNILVICLRISLSGTTASVDVWWRDVCTCCMIPEVVSKGFGFDIFETRWLTKAWKKPTNHQNFEINFSVTSYNFWARLVISILSGKRFKARNFCLSPFSPNSFFFTKKKKQIHQNSQVHRRGAGGGQGPLVKELLRVFYSLGCK